MKLKKKRYYFLQNLNWAINHNLKTCTHFDTSICVLLMPQLFFFFLLLFTTFFYKKNILYLLDRKHKFIVLNFFEKLGYLIQVILIDLKSIDSVKLS